MIMETTTVGLGSLGLHNLTINNRQPVASLPQKNLLSNTAFHNHRLNFPKHHANNQPQCGYNWTIGHERATLIYMAWQLELTLSLVPTSHFHVLHGYSPRVRALDS